MVARWHAHLHGLATAIHETSGLKQRGFVRDEKGDLPFCGNSPGLRLLMLEMQPQMTSSVFFLTTHFVSQLPYEETR